MIWGLSSSGFGGNVYVGLLGSDEVWTCRYILKPRGTHCLHLHKTSIDNMHDVGRDIKFLLFMSMG
jgi:hypothetical protein